MPSGIREEDQLAKEIVRVLNERPEALRVFLKPGPKIVSVRGDWNINIAVDQNDMIETYRKALNQSIVDPPMILTMLAGRAGGKIRSTRHPVALVPLTVLLERLNPAKIEDSVWSVT